MGGTAGTSAGWSAGAPPQPPNQTLAIVALVLGIGGCCVFIGIASIPAIIVGALALKRIKEDPQRYGGHGMAMTGLILGIVGVVAGIVLVIFTFAVIVPFVDFCEENPDDPQCEGFEQGNGTMTDAGQFQGPVRGPLPAWTPTWAVPARYA